MKTKTSSENIVFTKAEKNSTVVVISKDEYISKYIYSKVTYLYKHEFFHYLKGFNNQIPD